MRHWTLISRKQMGWALQLPQLTALRRRQNKALVSIMYNQLPEFNMKINNPTNEKKRCENIIKENTGMANKHTKRYLASLGKHKLKPQLNTTPYLLEWLKLKSLSYQVLVSTWSNRISHILLLRCKMEQIFCKKFGSFLKT